MDKDPLVFINHIKESIGLIEEYLSNVTKEEFLKNTKLQDALVRRLEIIGEAVKNIPDGFRIQHPNVAWIDIAGTRDKLTHHYFGVNLETVWKIIEEDIPKLKEQIKQILSK